MNTVKKVDKYRKMMTSSVTLTFLTFLHRY